MVLFRFDDAEKTAGARCEIVRKMSVRENHPQSDFKGPQTPEVS